MSASPAGTGCQSLGAHSCFRRHPHIAWSNPGPSPKHTCCWPDGRYCWFGNRDSTARCALNILWQHSPTGVSAFQRGTHETQEVISAASWRSGFRRTARCSDHLHHLTLPSHLGSLCPEVFSMLASPPGVCNDPRSATFLGKLSKSSLNSFSVGALIPAGAPAGRGWLRGWGPSALVQGSCPFPFSTCVGPESPRRSRGGHLTISLLPGRGGQCNRPFTQATHPPSGFFHEIAPLLVSIKHLLGLPLWLSGKEPTYNAGDPGDMSSIPGSGKSPGGGHGNPLQYPCLESPMDRGDCWATVHRVTKSRTWLSDWACTQAFTVLSQCCLEWPRPLPQMATDRPF